MDQPLLSLTSCPTSSSPSHISLCHPSLHAAPPQSLPTSASTRILTALNRSVRLGYSIKLKHPNRKAKTHPLHNSQTPSPHKGVSGHSSSGPTNNAPPSRGIHPPTPRLYGVPVPHRMTLQGRWRMGNRKRGRRSSLGISLLASLRQGKR